MSGLRSNRETQFVHAHETDIKWRVRNDRFGR